MVNALHSKLHSFGTKGVVSLTVTDCLLKFYKHEKEKCQIFQAERCVTKKDSLTATI